jgi:hypothetical protein
MSFPCENEKDLQSLAHWATDVLGCRNSTGYSVEFYKRKVLQVCIKNVVGLWERDGALAPGACRAFLTLRPRSEDASGYDGRSQAARAAERSRSMSSVTSRAMATEPSTSSSSPFTRAKVIST